MNDNQSFSARIIKGSALISAGGLLSKLVGLGSTLTVLHFLSLYEYGIYKLVFAAFGILASFLFSGLDNIVTADVAVDVGRKRIDRVKKLFLEFVVAKFIIGIILWAIVFFGAGIIESFYAKDIARYLRIISFLFLTFPLKAMLLFLFNLNLKFFRMSTLSIIEETIKLIFIFLFFSVFGLAIDGVILAYVLASFFSFFILFFFSLSFWKLLLKEKACSEPVLFNMIKNHGKWGILTNYNMDIQKNIHPWLIKFFIGTEAVAIVSVAQSLIGHATSLFPFVKTLMPTIPREIDNKERLKRVLFRGIKYSAIVFAFIGVAVFFITPYFIDLLFPKYNLSIPVFNILLITLLFTGIANIMTSFFYALKMQKDLFFIAIGRFVFMIIISAILFPYLGVIGVAMQIVLTYSFFLFMRFRAVIKKQPELAFNFWEFFKFDSYDRETLKRMRSYLKF